jgi:uncharacterized protein YaaQ
MKLILAIVNHDDAHTVIGKLTKGGFMVTKLATTGGFLMSGNATILVGVNDDRVADAIEHIKEASHSRKQILPPVPEPGLGFYPGAPVEVTVGGATIFVLDVDQFEKV